MKKQLLLILFSILAVAGYARVITGTVISESDNEPVIGATVMVKGTQRGVATDFDGKFSIEVKDGDVLSISNVGMLQQDVKVGKNQTLHIVMKEDAQLLGEVVVTAMGQTQEKKKLNFAVQQLDSKEITAGVSNNLASTLQGKVSGLQIMSTGGSPNASQTIQIRAISSIKFGFFNAAELIETLSAPASSNLSTSSTLEMPPPTVNGILMFSATRITIFAKVLRFSYDAVISRNTSSSAPSSQYLFPRATGSPASLRFVKFTPLTVVPSLTSRQGIIRFASMYL